MQKDVADLKNSILAQKAKNVEFNIMLEMQGDQVQKLWRAANRHKMLESGKNSDETISGSQSPIRSTTQPPSDLNSRKNSQEEIQVDPVDQTIDFDPKLLENVEIEREF